MKREQRNKDPELIERTLENGLTILHRRNQMPEGTVYLELIVKAGSIHEDRCKTGVAHFLEHMAFSGTESYKSGEFIKELQSLGVSFASHANAYTTFDHTVYHFQVQNTETHITKTLKVLSEIAGKITLPEKEIETQKKVILEERRLRLGKMQRLMNRVLSETFQGTDYEREVIGEETHIIQTNRNDLLEFYKKWYRPERMGLVIIGDVDIDTLMPVIHECFSYLKKSENLLEDPQQDLDTKVPQKIHLVTDPETTSGSIALLLPRTTLLDRIPSQKKLGLGIYYVVDILNERYLNALASVEQGILSLDGSFDPALTHFDIFSVKSDFQEGYHKEALSYLFIELIRLQRFGVHEEELDNAKAELIARYETMQMEKEDKDHGTFADDIHIYFLGNDEYTSVEDKLVYLRLYNASIDKKYIEEVIAEVIQPRQGHLFFELTEETLQKVTSEELGELLQQIEKMPLLPYVLPKEEELRKITHVPGKVMEKTEIAEIQMQHTLFENGFRFTSKNTDFEKDSVYVRIRIYAGAEFLSKEMQKLDNQFFVNAIMLGGTKRQTFEQFYAEAKKNNIDIGLSAGGQFFFELIAKSPVAKVEIMMGMAYELLYTPGFRDIGIGKAKNQIIQEIKNAQMKPEYVFSKRYQEIVFSNSPSTYVPSEEEIEKINKEELMDYYAEVMVPGNMEARMVGNLALEEMEQYMAENFGNIPVGKLPKYRAHSRMYVFPNGITADVLHKGHEPKSMGLLSYPGVHILHPDAPLLFVLGDILTNRMHDKIREELGGTYGVGVSHNAFSFLQGGTLELSLGSDPKMTKKLLEEVRLEIGRVKREGITSEELARVVSPIMEDRRTELTNNVYWLQMPGDTFTGIPYTFDVKQYDRLEKVTKEEIDEVLRTYFPEDNYVEIILYPKE